MEFKPGFRISAVDTGILIVGGASTVYLASVEPLASFMVTVVVGHFFLFCNVFRISRPPELIWAFAFTTMAVSNFYIGIPSWVVTTFVSIVISISVIFREIRLPSYHGIYWRRWNPQLEAWWQ